MPAGKRETGFIVLFKRIKGRGEAVNGMTGSAIFCLTGSIQESSGVKILVTICAFPKRRF